jgi:hypothetical protein
MTAVLEALLVEKQPPPEGYSRLLRPIGAYLDALHADQLLLAETAEGFMWRCFTRAEPARVTYGVIPYDELAVLTDSVKAARLGKVPDLDEEARLDSACAYGYEELLRCLGYSLDRRGASSFLLLEDDHSVLLQYTVRMPAYLRLESETQVCDSFFHEWVLGQPDIDAMVHAVRGCRGQVYFK